MLEPLAANGPPASDDWYYTSDVYKQKGVIGAVVDAIELPGKKPELLYSSLLGTPITRGNNISLGLLSTSELEDPRLQRLKENLLGKEVVSTHSIFTFETSYMKTNCSLQRASVEPRHVNFETALNTSKTNWNGTYNIVNNGLGMTVAYDL